jgi:septal ring factor EnvC (AmiA/AmiB activator)
MISPELTSLAVNGNQSDPLLLEAVRALVQFSFPFAAALVYFQLINVQIATSKEATEKQIAATEKQIATTEKQIAANKEATEKQIAATEKKIETTEKQIAANKEATEKQIAATEKQIAASKEATEKQIAATDKKIEADIKVTREITREVIMAANARFENILLQIKQDK